MGFQAESAGVKDGTIMKVTVYHGTTVDRGRRIINDGLIRTTSDDTLRYPDTKTGFVYVTKQLCDALDFSTRPEQERHNLTFVVFKIAIDEAELIPDEDEHKWASTLSPNGSKSCYKVGRDLQVGIDVIAVFQKKMESSNAIGRFMQAVQFSEIKVTETEWEKIT